MNFKFCVTFLIAVLTFCCSKELVAQRGLDRLKSLGNMSGGGGGDSLQHRDSNADSITITYRYLDSSRYRKFDSTISDFSKRFGRPPEYVYLGNTGSAARSIIFRPNMKPGWDAGFHSYDIYQTTFEDTRFYTTTRPYTELGYIIGSRTEQDIKLIHTQNITSDWNAAFRYTLYNAPGLLKNQNTNINTIKLNTAYQSKSRRYHIFFILNNNKVEAAENGGIRTDKDYLNDMLTYSNRALIPVQLGNSLLAGRSVFSTNVSTGTKYKTSQLMFRHQYDFGIKDSIVTDSTVIKLFYPKFRIEHTIQTGNYSYAFADKRSDVRSDSDFYSNYGLLPDQLDDSIDMKDQWKEFVNDLSVYQFPDSRNSQQFVKVGATIQTLKGTFGNDVRHMHNIFLHGEYRNKTRNKKWDIEANGELYVNGFNSGDYGGYVSLRRFISKKLGYLQGGLHNVNRTPSFVFNNASSFNKEYFSATPQPSFNKENITNIFASIEQPQYNLTLTGSYYLVSNYTYFKGFKQADQASSLFNMLQIGAQKHFRVGKRWNFDAEVTVQQKTGAAPVNVPLIFTRDRFYYQGNLGFKNLLFVFGTEIKYHTAYKADSYSPLYGQFVYQEDTTVRLKAPEIALFMHFRIKTFTAYVRGENLNSVSLRNGFGFTSNNFAAPNYIYPGLLIRIGIFWAFIN